MDGRSPQDPSPRRPLLALSPPVIAAAVGVVLVVYQWANARPLWLDEQMIALNIRDRGFTDLSGRLWLDQSAPLGWLMLQRVLVTVLGTSELVLRVVPAAFGAATIVAALYIGERWLTIVGSTILVLVCAFGQWISFYAIELKSYSADTFFGLLLPALAVAAAIPSVARRNAILLWVVTAALAHWFSLGALLVLPACYAVMVLSARRDRDALRLFAAGAVVLVVSIGANYLLSLGYTRANDSLHGFWQFAFPPADGGVSGTIQWFYEQLEPFALKPGGTARTALFWILAGIGFAFASWRSLGLLAGLIVATGFGLAALRIIPFYERLSLWFLPALYLGIALAADRSVWFFNRRPLGQPWMNVAAAGTIAAMFLPLVADTVERGIRDIRTSRPSSSNHETNDRAAIAWLMEQRQPGDQLITTKHALPAVWWYGGVPISASGGRTFEDGGRILTAEYHKSPRTCHGRELEKVIDGQSRILVYLGFADQPPGFDDLLLENLTKFGTVTALQHFAGTSRAAIVDPRIGGGSNLFWEDAGKDTGTWLKGCILAGQGRAW